MAEGSGTNALVVLGLVLLIVGGLGFVYGQLQLQEQGGDDGGGDGNLLDVTVGDSDGNGQAGSIDRVRFIRLAGVVLGAIGAVAAVVGGTVG